MARARIIKMSAGRWVIFIQIACSLLVLSIAILAVVAVYARRSDLETLTDEPELLTQGELASMKAELRASRELVLNAQGFPALAIARADDPETGDVTSVAIKGNPHLYGRCTCECHGG